MYVSNIIFSQKAIDEEILELINDLIHSLHHKGISIALRNFSFQRNNEIVVQIKIPEQTSLGSITEYKWAKKLLELGVDIQVEILGKDIETNEVCICSKPSFYIFLGTHNIPLVCGDCQNSVPLYRIPYTDESDNYYNICCWNKENLAWSEIEFYSFEESFAHKQLCDISSSHNKTALELRYKIEKVSQTKCYYYFEELRYVKNLKIAKDKKCPCCGGIWYQKEPFLNMYDFKCDNCQILSTLPHLDE